MHTGARRTVSPLAVVPPGALVVLAAWSVQQLPSVPGQASCIVLVILGLCLLPAGRGGLLAGTLLAAIGWSALQANHALDARLAPALEGRDLAVVGVVDQLPQPFERGLRFRFRIERCVASPDACPGPVAVRLTWYRGFGGARETGPPAIRPGQRWQLNVRLKRPHASLNPGQFDPELRALEEGIAAHGYVRKGSDARPNLALDEWSARPAAAIERLREVLRERIGAALAQRSAHARGVVVALVIGDQAAIPSRWWEVFNRTGVGHLMSISGLHITMLAALAAGAAGRVWRSRRLAAALGRHALPALLPAPYARWACGLVVAFGYSLLAGWGIPAQRTCWMLAVAGVALLGGRARSPLAVVSSAAAVVCVLDPWAPLAAGFWLSFAAVSAIIWYAAARGDGRSARANGGLAAEPGPHAPSHSAAADPGASEPGRPLGGWLRVRAQGRRALIARLRATLLEALRAQYAATLVLIPLGVVFFSSVSLVSPLANAFAIPLVSGLITPIALAGGALSLAWSDLGALVLAGAGWLTEWLLGALDWVDPGGAASLAIPAPSGAALLLSAVACAWLLAPMPVPGRAVAGLALLPLVLAPPDQPAAGELRITALDVGQGMAVLVEAENRKLLYDTGPQLGEDSEAGSRVIVPYLRARGIRKLDALVVSHLDLDHSGGALSVLRNLRVDWVASSLPDAHPIVAAAPRHFRCRRGERWQWGNVRFEWLHPGDDPAPVTRSPTNAVSCVLRIEAPAGTVLLAGDIEAAQERLLLERDAPEALRAQVLLAPHHGSITSSLPAFLDAVRPSHAIFQVGYRNRYRHPNPQVLRRYEARGVEVLRTDDHAAITVRMREGAPPAVGRLRLDDRRYWRILPGGTESTVR